MMGEGDYRMRQRLGIDLDDVVADYVLGAIRKFGWPNTWIGRLKNWWPSDVMGTHFEPYTHANFLRGLSVVPGAMEGLFALSLSEVYEPFILTARQAGGPEEATTRAWWKEHQLPDMEILSVGSFANKSVYLRDNSSTRWLIDDWLQFVMEMEATERNAILVNAPWNQEATVQHRAHGWRDIRAILGV